MNHILVSKENFDFFSHILPEEYYTEGTRITLGAYDNDGVVHGVISYVSLGYECIIDWIFVEAASRSSPQSKTLVSARSVPDLRLGKTRVFIISSYRWMSLIPSIYLTGIISVQESL